ncbi:BRISC complex subunit FAM175B-like isoform X2 [Linepithema humile]|nr:PREDICTED: BRCA1-A complex subunit Abraxas-like isoform X2 [Linepithema humile]
MADGDLLVTISGAALSLLFFENVRSVGDQVGFLLGEALEYVVKTYTDSDNQVETVKIHINVETIVTYPMSDLMHSFPRIDKEKLKDFIRDKSKQVIGWFHFHRNSNSLTPTLRDKVLHKQFASYFSVENGCKEEFFLTCLLSASTSETRGTHKFRHVFLRRNRGILEPVSLRINNLGDDASRHDGSDYKPTPVRKSARESDSFTELIKSLNLDMTRIGGLDSAMKIQKAAEHHLMSLIPKVCESDMEVTELEKQVHELKAIIAAQQLAKKSNVNGENCERTKTSRENCISEKINLLMKNEIKIGDGGRLQREHMPSCAQANTNSRISHRNTAAYLSNSLNQEKIRRRGRGIPMEGSKQQQNTLDPFVTNSKRSIPEIATESICQEGCEASIGRGRGSGRSNHEFVPGMKNARCVPSTQMQSSSPEQDFSDAESPNVIPASPPLHRSYSQATKKTNVDKGNTMASLDI